MTRLVLIDLDDTLWDTQRNNKESLSELYTALNWGQYFVSFEAFFEVYFPINIALWEQYARGEVDERTLSIERLRRPLAPFEKHSDTEWLSYDDQLMELIRSKRGLCPGALETLEYLHGRYPVCMLSNGFGRVQYAKVQDSGLAPHVDAIVLSEEVGFRKPDPRIFAHALDLMKVSPSESIMIGDSWSADIVGASRSGVPSVWYNPHGFPAPSIPEGESFTPPQHIITHLSELREIL